MDGPEWAAGKLSEDHKDNRWSLLSADLRELEQQIQQQKEFVTTVLEMLTLLEARTDYLETVCEQCILEHQGRSV